MLLRKSVDLKYVCNVVHTFKGLIKISLELSVVVVWVKDIKQSFVGIVWGDGKTHKMKYMNVGIKTVLNRQRIII